MIITAAVSLDTRGRIVVLVSCFFSRFSQIKGILMSEGAVIRGTQRPNVSEYVGGKSNGLI